MTRPLRRSDLVYCAADFAVRLHDRDDYSVRHHESVGPATPRGPLGLSVAAAATAVPRSLRLGGRPDDRRPPVPGFGFRLAAADGGILKSADDLAPLVIFRHVRPTEERRRARS